MSKQELHERLEGTYAEKAESQENSEHELTLQRYYLDIDDHDQMVLEGLCLECEEKVSVKTDFKDKSLKLDFLKDRFSSLEDAEKNLHAAGYRTDDCAMMSVARESKKVEEKIEETREEVDE